VNGVVGRQKRVHSAKRSFAGFFREKGTRLLPQKNVAQPLRLLFSAQSPLALGRKGWGFSYHHPIRALAGRLGRKIPALFWDA